MALQHLIGAHVSTANGIWNTIETTNALHALSFALFLKNQKRWVSKPYEQKDIDKFHAKVKEYKIDPLRQILPHASYLINLANPDPEKWNQSYKAFIDDLQRCEQLGIGLYNMHPGSSLGSSKEEAIKRIAKGINMAINETQFVKVVLENMTGNPERIVGTDLSDLKNIIGLIGDKSRIGVCIDTCHSFCAGYDLRTKTVFDIFWSHFDDTIGYEHLSGIHLNDSKFPFDSKRDVHQNLGHGFLGLEPFRLIMNKKELEGIPLILETPVYGDNPEIRSEEIELLKWLVGRTDNDDDYIKKTKELQEDGLQERLEMEKKHLKTMEKKAASTRPKRKRS